MAKFQLFVACLLVAAVAVNAGCALTSNNWFNSWTFESFDDRTVTLNSTFSFHGNLLWLGNASEWGFACCAGLYAKT